jgi:hypothetical protein
MLQYSVRNPLKLWKKYVEQIICLFSKYKQLKIKIINGFLEEGITENGVRVQVYFSLTENKTFKVKDNNSDTLEFTFMIC